MVRHGGNGQPQPTTHLTHTVARTDVSRETLLRRHSRSGMESRASCLGSRWDAPCVVVSPVWPRWVSMPADCSVERRQSPVKSMGSVALTSHLNELTADPARPVLPVGELGADPLRLESPHTGAADNAIMIPSVSSRRLRPRPSGPRPELVVSACPVLAQTPVWRTTEVLDAMRSVQLRLLLR